MLIASLKIFSILFQFVFILSSLIGIPGNIISLILPLIWWLTGYITFWQFIIITIIIAIGEILEQFMSIASGKKSGINNKSMIFSFIFAIILSILMAPILFGIGAIIGAFLGAFLGTFIYEYTATTNFSISIKRGIASLKGRVLGTVLKLALGISSVIVTIIYLF